MNQPTLHPTPGGEVLPPQHSATNDMDPTHSVKRLAGVALHLETLTPRPYPPALTEADEVNAGPTFGLPPIEWREDVLDKQDGGIRLDLAQLRKDEVHDWTNFANAADRHKSPKERL